LRQYNSAILLTASEFPLLECDWQSSASFLSVEHFCILNFISPRSFFQFLFFPSLFGGEGGSLLLSYSITFFFPPYCFICIFLVLRCPFFPPLSFVHILNGEDFKFFEFCWVNGLGDDAARNHLFDLGKNHGRGLKSTIVCFIRLETVRSTIIV